MINIIPSDITGLQLLEGIFWLGWSCLVLLATVIYAYKVSKQA